MSRKENERRRAGPTVAVALGLALLFSAPVVTMCRQDDGGRWDEEYVDEDEGSGEGDIDQHVIGCDPDGLEPCVDEYFICTTDEAENKICEGREPAVPDAGDWMCVIEEGELICWGDHFPDNDEWVCEELPSGHIECRAPAPGDAGADENYDCYYEDEFIICEERGEEDEEGWVPDDGHDNCPPGVELGSAEICGDRIDNDCDGFVDENCVEGCVCIPGAWRYCDTPTYCRWGIQYCNDDGLTWGYCEETSPPSGCDDNYIYSTSCCISIGACCQDFWDEDGDGNIHESLGDCVDIVCM